MRIFAWVLILGTLTCSSTLAKDLPVVDYRPTITSKVRETVQRFPGAREAFFKRIFGDCGNPCIFEGKLPGGDYEEHEFAAAALLAGARSEVQIHWECASACTVFMDLARERVCIGPETVLAFHRGLRYRIDDLQQPRATGILVPRYSPDIERWIRLQGGLPRNGGYIYMHYRNAKKIWRTRKE